MNQSKTFLLVILILGLTYGCHTSCQTCSPLNNNQCATCKDPNAELAVQNRICRCKQGYVKMGLTNSCELPISDDDAQFMDPCEIEFVQYAADIPLDVVCGNSQVDNQNYVYTRADLRLSSSPLNANCYSIIRSRVVWYTYGADPALDSTVRNSFPETYIQKQNFNSQITITIPLIDVYQYAEIDEINTEYILQKMQVGVIFSHARHDIRENSWGVFVYTGRKQVNVVSLDVSKKYTQGCEEGKECVILQDLDTKINICTDSTCAEFVDGTPTYEVGDMLYVKVSFIDPSYTKWLELKNVVSYIDGIAYDHNPVSTPQYSAGSTIVEVFLLEPSLDSITVEVTTSIVTSEPGPFSGRFRRLQQNSEKTAVIQSQISFKVDPSTKSGQIISFIFAMLIFIICF